MLTREPIVQIHASRFCNYACLHCYSSSSPFARESLSVEDILSTTHLLADEGYRHASLSGGEPVLYKDYDALAKGLFDQGFHTSVITNGTQTERLLPGMRAGYIQHASVSFDGDEKLHDTVRQKAGAFQRACKALEDLLNAGLSTGVVISVTQQSMPILPNFIDSLVQLGVTQFQLHPLASVGRAVTSIDELGPELSQEALLRLILLTMCLRKKHPAVEIHSDAIISDRLDFGDGQIEGSLISPIVLRDDGKIVPYAYDVSLDLELGHVGAAALTCHVAAPVGRVLRAAFSRAREKLATTVYREIVGCSKPT
ncbi:radical SAM protein [Sulfitobacter geojensis]|uniref:Radical SAM protein n=1 Tax=Sulfitobacter geojensis TaxID=1342299 RepID=A0AAE3B8Q6_9RHOB|nr:radical SAM protein [Sulfitobacter geojensis]MBM1691610.1 radical SAM protein [Sulfitobacter geojensis]MBM1695676.1 radical SAM protein [Sulfitobacter geojensis]MBM1707841.1 radical SAM protein [Sulfitobacter geojensis]MBM1711900.1 radical SAM protein [Sulfitobacter geojensis]MBM1715965.1 radical SAM protein [Sulfitobacter geojensis]